MAYTKTLWIVIICVAVLISPYTSLAKDDVKVPLSSDASQDGAGNQQEPPQSPQGAEQERYNRLYKEYVNSFNKAVNDEERERLRKKFEEDTKAYQKSLAEKNELIKRNTIDKERQALENEYQLKIGQMKQNHRQRVRRLEQECRRETLVSKEVFGERSSGLNLEPAICQKKPLLEQEFNRDLTLLTNDYNARMRTLQRE